LSKLFETILTKLDGSTPDINTEFLKMLAGLEGIAPEELIPKVNELLSKEYTGDEGTKCKNTVIAVFPGATKEKLAETLAECMNDPAFKSAFEKANPGILEAMKNKEMVGEMSKIAEEMADLKSAKDMVDGASGAAGEQTSEIDDKLNQLLKEMLKDIDGAAGEELKKKTLDFAEKVKAAHTMLEKKQLDGIAD